MVLTPARAHLAAPRRGAAWRRAAVAGPPLVVLLAGALALDGVRRTRDATAWVDHTYRVLAAADGVLARLTDAETGQRGFLLTGRDAYLAPYAAAERDVAARLTALRALTRNDPAQQARLDTLAGLTRVKFAEMAHTVALRRAAGADAARRVVETDEGKAAMDRARAVIARVGAAERGLLAARQRAAARAERHALALLAAGTVVAGLLALLVNALLTRALAGAERATAAAAAAARELEAANDQLQEQAAELEAKTDELQAAAAELEERTEAADAARAHAEEANAAKGQFLAVMSHELRTPLNAIGGYAQLLDMGLHGPVTDDQRGALARVQAAQRHLLGLITDILNYAKLEAGRVDFNVRPVDVGDVVRDVVPLVAPQLAAKRLALDLQLPAAAPADGGGGAAPYLAWADRDKLGQVLVNLLSNAAKFTDAGGRVTVAVAADAPGGAPGDAPGGRLLVRVADTGRGIPRERQAAIFEPFVQVDARLTRAHEGVGLGLAISRDLARGMGGDLTVASAPGAGSTFTVALRRVVDPARRPPDRRGGGERRGGERRSGADRRDRAPRGPGGGAAPSA